MSSHPTLYLNSYHVKDKHGNVESCTAWDQYDEVYICVKEGDEGQYNLIYNCEAKHLRDWCKAHGLQLRHQIVEVEIPNPFELE